MSGLPREVVKWIQSLDLTFEMRVPKWDMHNGYLMGEILSKYFPGEIMMYSFYNCTSLEVKMKNWYIIMKFLQWKQLNIPEQYIEGTIHCKEGAATMLLEHLFKMLTKRTVKKPPETEPDMTDYSYQVKLPMHARCTASTAVSNNLRLTELLYEKNLDVIAQKAEEILRAHNDHRRTQRQEDPQRFGITPTLAERCLRHEPPVAVAADQPEEDIFKSTASFTVVQVDSSSGASRPSLRQILQ